MQGMKTLADTIIKMEEEAKSKTYQASDNQLEELAKDYDIKDGIPHCRKCGEPVAVNLNLSFLKGLYPRACKCKREEDALISKQINETKRQIRIKELREKSLYLKKYENARFENTAVRGYASFDNALKRCKRYCEVSEEVLKQNQGIYIYGDKGCGKTHLTMCMFFALTEKMHTCIMTSFGEIGNRIKATFTSSSRETEEYIVEELANVDFLFIDDIGTESAQRGGEDTWLQDKVFEVINARYNNNKPIIFTSNHSIAELTSDRGYMPKTIDRINEMSTAIISIKGVPSYRVKQVEETKALF